MNGKYYIVIAFAAGTLAAGCSNSNTPNNSGNNSASMGANNTVFDAIYVGNSLYVAGNFDSIGGTWIKGIGEWDGSKWSNIGSPLSEFVQGSIHALATDGANLYIGGDFYNTIGTENLQATAEWTGTAWHSIPPPGGVGFSRGVDRTAYGNGLLYVAAADYLSKYDGSAWTSIDNGLPAFDSMTSMVTFNGDLLTVFTSISFSQPRTYLWKYDGQWTEIPQAFSYTSATGPGIHLAVSDNDVYAVGDFSAVGSTQLTSYGVAKWDGTNWSSVGTLSGTNKVTAVAVDPSGNLYIGEPNALMEYNGTGWSTVATTSGGFGNTGTIRTIAVSANHLAIGGDFTSVNGSTANYIAILK